MGDKELEDQVMEALKGAVDPELGASLLDLGMIKGVRIKDGIVEVDMILTSPLCPLASYMVNDVKDRIKSVKGVKEVKVKVVGFGLPESPSS